MTTKDKKNLQDTDLKKNPDSPNYHGKMKNKANEHTPYGEKEPSTHTEYR